MLLTIDKTVINVALSHRGARHGPSCFTEGHARHAAPSAKRNWGAAVAAFVTVAALQQKALDDPNMVRALAMAGDASMQMGQLREATSFFFRAGRSAARLDMEDEALQWLSQAQQLTQHTGDKRMRTDSMAQLMTLKARLSSQGQLNTR
jgi:hypothetical protein